MPGMILHAEYFEYIRLLSEAEAASLWGLLDAFVNGGDVESLSRQASAAVQITFKVISERAGREMQRCEAITRRNRENGKKGGRPKKAEEENRTETEENPTETQQKPNDNPKNLIPIPIPIPIEKEKSIKEKSRFKKPTVEEVEAYCRERGNSLSAQGFINYYDSVGWVIGKDKPMRDWRAAVRTWEQRDKKTVAKSQQGNRFHNFEQRKIDYDAILRAELEAEAKADGI